MIGRLWKTGLKSGKGSAYDTFAREISLPMFRCQIGFMGCIMFRSDSEASVLTVWRDIASVTALENASTYKETVSRILQANILEEPQSVSLGTVHLSDFDALVVNQSTNGTTASPTS